MKTLLAALLAVFFTSACGQPDAFDRFQQSKRKPRAVNVNVWQGSDVLAARKQQIVKSCQARGASDARVALLLAMAMQETTDLSCSQRDASKDNTPAANFSAFNANADFLGRLGWKEGEGPDLNKDENLDAAVGWILKSFEVWDENRSMAFHRGGYTAFCDGQSYGAQEFKDQMRAVQVYLMQNRDAWTSSQRIGGFLEHV